MSESTSSVRVNLSGQTRDAIDRAASELRTTRSEVIKELVDRHLDGLLEERRAGEARRSKGIESLLKLADRAPPRTRFKTAEEVDAYIRSIRGDS